MRHSCLLAASAALILSGCTHLETARDYTTSGFNSPIAGIPYALPALQYQLKVTNSITGCPAALAIDEREFSDGALAFTTKVEPTKTYVAGERFVADYMALTSILKTTGYSIETYPSGILKSVNVSAEDQSGPFISNLVAIGLTAVGTPGFFGPSGVRATPRGARPPKSDIDRLFDGAPVGAIMCTQQTSGNLASKASAENLLEGLTKQLKDATAEVERLTAIAANERSDHNDLMLLKSALERQAIAQTALEGAQGQQQKSAAPLNVAGDARWPAAVTAPPTPADLSASVELNPADVQAFAGKLQLKPMTVITKARFSQWWNTLSPSVQQSFVDTYGNVAANFGVTVGQPASVPPPDDIGVCGGERTFDQCIQNMVKISGLFELKDRPSESDGDLAAPTQKQPQPGLFIRTQQKADVTLCRGVTPCAKPNRLLYERDVSAPQFGQLRFLPFSNRMFEAATLSLAMREDGSVEKFEYKRTKAIAVEASAAVKDAVSQFKTFSEEQNKKAADALTASRAEEIAGVQHQIDVLNKQAELLKLQNPAPSDPVKDETAVLEAETALLEAKLSKLKAEAALLQASSGGN